MTPSVAISLLLAFGLNGALALPSIGVPSMCTPNTFNTSQLQAVLTNGGEGATLSLCPSQIYNLTDTLNFTAPNQQITTFGSPLGEARAMLVVTGQGQTCAVNGQQGLYTCNGAKLSHVQINGNRGSASIYSGGNANIEMGGDSSGQVVEYVRSFDPRSWSCLHIAEGQFKCIDFTAQNNDIGPCGHDAQGQWSDGISLSCANSLVQNNVVTDPTDGGIVIFESPGSTIRNNIVRARTRVSLGGINMVDQIPWMPFGNYTHTIVENNRIEGGFATSFGNSTFGPNANSTLIKVGLGIGPDTWWNDGRYGNNQSTGATVLNNVFTGAFTFGMVLGGVRTFHIAGNHFEGNVSFIGTYGPYCSTGADLPHPPAPFLMQSNLTSNSTISVPPWNPAYGVGTNLQPIDFQFINGTVLGMTCFLPPAPTEFVWPYNKLDMGLDLGKDGHDGDGHGNGHGHRGDGHHHGH